MNNGLDDVAEIQAAIARACHWAGVQRGRAVDYQRLIREFLLNGGASADNIFAVDEALQLVEMCNRLWGVVDDFPGLRPKIRMVLAKGPLLRRHENVRKATNQSRNHAFTYFLAGHLIDAGISVRAIDGCLSIGFEWHDRADLTIKLGSTLVDVECKRPQAESRFLPSVKDALEQLKKMAGRNGSGIIAIDCSRFAEPSKQFAKKLSGQALEDGLGRYLVDLASPDLLSTLPPNILGFVLYMRLPSLSAAVLRHPREPDQKIIRYNQRTHFNYACCPNERCEDSAAFHVLEKALQHSIRGSHRSSR